MAYLFKKKKKNSERTDKRTNGRTDEQTDVLSDYIMPQILFVGIKRQPKSGRVQNISIKHTNKSCLVDCNHSDTSMIYNIKKICFLEKINNKIKSSQPIRFSKTSQQVILCSATINCPLTLLYKTIVSWEKGT